MGEDIKQFEEDRDLTIDEKMDVYRKELKYIGASLMRELDRYKNKDTKDSNENPGEVIANIMLAYRHIEDASMRLGKVKQHLNDGVSVYDKNVVGSPE